jgi:hypothetical protein
VTLGVNHIVAAPFPDVGSLEHASLPPRSATPPFADDATRMGAADTARQVASAAVMHLTLAVRAEYFIRDC